MPNAPSKTPAKSSDVDVTALGNCIVLDDQGRRMKLSHFWAQKNAIFIFLRHFACIACRAHAIQVWNQKEKYESTGARLIFIGNGSADYIKIFQADLEMEKATILTDPSLETFRLAGFRNGVLALAQLKSILNAAKLVSEGYSQPVIAPEGSGSHLQLGGVLAINTMNKVTYHFVSEALGDFPKTSDIEFLAQTEKAKMAQG
jgi:peroxiredoxin